MRIVFTSLRFIRYSSSITNGILTEANSYFIKTIRLWHAMICHTMMLAMLWRYYYAIPLQKRCTIASSYRVNSPISEFNRTVRSIIKSFKLELNYIQRRFKYLPPVLLGIYRMFTQVIIYFLGQEFIQKKIF